MVIADDLRSADRSRAHAYEDAALRREPTTDIEPDLRLPIKLRSTLSLAVYVRDTEPRVSADKVDVDLVDPTIILERHPIRIVFEDGRATILSDIERFIDRIDERNRVVDSGFSDFGLIRAESSRSSNRA
jgi:hypothetical protein